MQPIILMDQRNKILNRDFYSFRGNESSLQWPKKFGHGLGSCGSWNFLWRLGYHPKQLNFDQFSGENNSNIIFVDSVQPLDNLVLEKIYNWLQKGKTVIATGELSCWEVFLPRDYEWKTSCFNNPYAAGAYVINESQPQLAVPHGWTFIERNKITSDTRCIGNIAAIEGERQTPSRAFISPHNNAPAIIQNNSFYYFNAQPFAAFQAWLQGQEDLSPWLAWRHRLFWLDEWVSFFYDLMIKLDIFGTLTKKPGLALNKTAVILRHDLDHSKDTAFLEEENKRNLGATYAILKDRNRSFWVKELAQFKNHEIAFHYNTARRNWLGVIYKILAKKNPPSFLKSNIVIAKNGLLNQLKWAKKKGIDIQTIHRHLSFLIYPEWIDALDTVFESNLGVLASSSLFRGQILKWGTDRVEGQHGFLAEWPDAQFPLWYPFKLAHAAKSGKILRGWEMTSLMEIEPHLLTQLLDHKIKHISQSIFTLNFHPAHASKSSFYKEGSFNYFKTILDIILERNIDILPMYKVLQAANNSLSNENE